MDGWQREEGEGGRGRIARARFSPTHLRVRGRHRRVLVDLVLHLGLAQQLEHALLLQQGRSHGGSSEASPCARAVLCVLLFVGVRSIDPGREGA